MGTFSLFQGFEHCNKFEIFFPDLKIVITDFFKPGFFVKIYCSLVAVKHGKPDFIGPNSLALLNRESCNSNPILIDKKSFRT